MCKLSVIMPVYNGEQFLGEAIDSILNQTFMDFELLILLEYGSNQESKDIIISYTDNRIKLIENKQKLGLPESLNSGIRLAKGEYIARMDSDDVSYPKRFEKQIKYLEKNPHIVLCGTGIKVNGHKRVYSCTDFESIRFSSFFECPFMHPTVMWRRKEFTLFNLYYKELFVSEDYELWIRVLEHYKAANLHSTLLMYRKNLENRSIIFSKQAMEKDREIRRDYFNKHNIVYDLEKDFFESSLSEDDIVKREQIVKSLCNLWETTSNVRQQTVNVMIRVYFSNHIFKFKRYWDSFSYIYPHKYIYKTFIRFYFFYRNMRRFSHQFIKKHNRNRSKIQ